MTSKKSILKLSRREERECREAQAARSKRKLVAAHTRWDDLRASLDAQLVLLDESNRWRGFSVSVRPEREYETARIARKRRKARKNKAVFERDNFTCRDCYQEFDHPEPYRGEPIPGLTRGHIIPASKGGTTAISNLIAQCQPCNWALGDRVWSPEVLTVPEWMEVSE